MNLETGAITLEAQNLRCPELDDRRNFVIRAATAFGGNQSHHHPCDGADKPWRDLVMPLNGRFRQVVNSSLIASFALDGKSL